MSTKITDLTEAGEALADGDYLPVVNVSDVTQAATGSTRKSLLSRFWAYVQGKSAALSEIGGALADADTITVIDATDSTEKRVLMSRLLAYLQLGSLRPPSTIACLGDSHSERNSDDYVSGSTRLQRYRADGYLTWANIALKQRFTFTHALNFGVSGETTEEMLLRVGDVTASDAGVCVVLGGTNDITAGWGYARITAALQSIYEALLAAGILVVAIPIPPRVGATSSQWLNQYAANRWIRRYCVANDGMLLADPTHELTDPTHVSGDPVTGMLVSDGIHFDVTGAQVVGDAVASALASVSAPNVMLPVSNLDIYDATSNPEGNLLTNGAMDGAVGSVTAPITGSSASSWALLRTAGTSGAGTIVGSKEARTDGPGEWQVITVAGLTGGTWNTIVLRQYVNVNGDVTLGDIIEAEAEVDLSGAALVGSVDLHVREFNGATYPSEVKCNNYSIDTSACADFSGVLRTPPFSVKDAVTASTQLQVFLTLRVDASGAGAACVAKIGRVDLRKVIA